MNNEITATHVALSAAWLAVLAVAGFTLPLGIVIGMLGALCAAAGAVGYRMLTQSASRQVERTQPLLEWTVAEEAAPQLPQLPQRRQLPGGG